MKPDEFTTTAYEVVGLLIRKDISVNQAVDVLEHTKELLKTVPLRNPIKPQAEPCTVSEKEILEHYGYDSAKFEADEKAGMGCGYWPRDIALQRLKALPDFIRFFDPNKKIRIVFEYDPDFPVAIFTATGKKDTGV